MAKQANRRSTASPARKAKRASSDNLPPLDDVRDGIGSAVTSLRRDGRQMYRAAENRFGRTSTISMLTIAGVGVAVGALLLGVASARSVQQSRSRRA